MPELPDLLYIRDYLSDKLVGKKITSVEVKEPVVLRVAVEETFEQAIRNRTFSRIEVHGPFLKFSLSPPLDLVMNLMLAGRLQHQTDGQKAEVYLCFAIHLDDGSSINLCDSQRMAKVYLIQEGEFKFIPRYQDQGVDVLSKDFSLDLFNTLARQHSRKQVRVFINDHSSLSAIGNAYADEILFEARIHPKTLVARLTTEDVKRLFDAVTSTLEWGILHVRNANQPIHIKVRNHMRVRNRKGIPCPVCGTTIRREGVRGYDVYFCPECQPPTRKSFITWKPS